MMNDTMAPEDESLPQDPAQDSASENGSTDSPPEKNTFFVPAGSVGGHVKPGDTLTFKVVGKDSEGDYEVELDTGDDNAGDFMGDMMKTMKGGSNG